MSMCSSNPSEMGRLYLQHTPRMPPPPPPAHPPPAYAAVSGAAPSAAGSAPSGGDSGRNQVSQVEGPGWAQMFAEVDAREMLAMSELSAEQRREHYISQVLRLRTSSRLYPLLVIDCSDSDEGEIFFGIYVKLEAITLGDRWSVEAAFHVEVFDGPQRLHQVHLSRHVFLPDRGRNPRQNMWGDPSFLPVAAVAGCKSSKLTFVVNVDVTTAAPNVVPPPPVDFRCAQLPGVDVQLNCGNGQLFAHSQILSLMSGYFRTVLSAEKFRSRMSSVDLSGHDLQEVRLLLSFLYPDCCHELTSEILIPLFEMSLPANFDCPLLLHQVCKSVTTRLFKGLAGRTTLLRCVYVAVHMQKRDPGLLDVAMDNLLRCISTVKDIEDDAEYKRFPKVVQSKIMTLICKFLQKRTG